MNTNTNRIKQWQEQEALSRFQLIAPLLQEDLDDAKRLQLRKQIAQDNDISVRSIYRYEKAYREGQFAGLKPATREKRRSQKLPENFDLLLEQAIQLRKEVPERSVAQIICILELEGYAAPGVLKRSTLERHLYRAGYGREQMQIYRDARGSSSKRFCDQRILRKPWCGSGSICTVHFHIWTGQRRKSMSKATWIMRNAARKSLPPKQWTKSIRLQPGFRE